MPELPEVETVRLFVDTYTGGKLTAFQVKRANSRYKNVTQERVNRLLDQVLSGVERIGKYLFFHFGPNTLVIHLGMSGALLKHARSEGRHVKIEMQFEYDTEGEKETVPLYFDDTRNFGQAAILLGAYEFSAYVNSRLGYDALDLPWQPFRDALRRSTDNVELKSLLLNQFLVAGVGNIYACEVLFLARLNPWQTISNTTDEQLYRIWLELSPLLHRSLKAQGTTMKGGTYVNGEGEGGSFLSQLKVYGRSDQACMAGNCVGTVQVWKDTRSTYYCPVCQGV